MDNEENDTGKFRENLPSGLGGVTAFRQTAARGSLVMDCPPEELILKLLNPDRCALSVQTV